MILDTVAHAAGYAGLHPGFAGAFDFLSQADWTALAPGRHDIDGDRLFVLVQEHDGLGNDGARLEAHRAYIDIQFTIDGAEQIGWMPVARCRQMASAFDEARDIVFFDDRPMTWVAVPPGGFAIFFPHDAHAPLGGEGRLKKAVVKIAV